VSQTNQTESQIADLVYKLQELTDEPCIANEGNPLIPRLTSLEHGIREAVNALELLQARIKELEQKNEDLRYEAMGEDL